MEKSANTPNPNSLASQIVLAVMLTNCTKIRTRML